MAEYYDVLGIGCVAVDDVLYVDGFPEADEKVRIKRSERRFGGLTGAALVAAAKLGGRCGFGGLLGGDELSAAAEENLRACGVDTSFAVRRPGARVVHSVVVVAEGAGTRNIFFDASPPTGADVEGPSEHAIRAAKVVFVDNVGVAGALRAARIAREAGIPVVADLESDDDPLFRDLLAQVDHLILSAGFASKVSGRSEPREAARALWNEDRQAVVVTDGTRGAWFAESRSGGHQAAFPVCALDTTGCGDVFHGAYALALARGEDAANRIRFASAAAALKAALGGPFPGPEEVRELLARP